MAGTNGIADKYATSPPPSMAPPLSAATTSTPNGIGGGIVGTTGSGVAASGSKISSPRRPDSPPRQRSFKEWAGKPINGDLNGTAGPEADEEDFIGSAAASKSPRGSRILTGATTTTAATGAGAGAVGSSPYGRKSWTGGTPAVAGAGWQGHDRNFSEMGPSSVWAEWSEKTRGTARAAIGDTWADRVAEEWDKSKQRLNGLPLPIVISRLPTRRPRQLLLVAALFLFLLLYRWFAAPRTPTSAALSLKRLSAIPPGLDRGNIQARPLMNYANPYGFISLIDPYAGGVFNPSLLVLPDSVYLGSRILMVARGPERVDNIDREDVRWQTVFGLFVIPMNRKVLNLPYLARESDLYTLKLPAERKMSFRRCENKDMDQFIGAEDPRLFFTNDGQPLLIYSQTGHSPMICRAINIIDARIVVPGLKDAMDKAGWKAPIHFTDQTDLVRSEQYNIEKNWAPFLGDGDELWFHVSLVPQEIYKYVANVTLRPLDPSPPTRNCITEMVGADTRRVHFHHATPLLRVTMCKRGDCIPDVGNTLLFGIIHLKYHPEPYLFYERRVVTWNITSPYEYISVSKALTYVGTNQADPIFTVSMSWNHPTANKGLGLNHGFLGERVLLSFGVFDYGSAYLEVLVDDLLAEHSLCEPTYSLWS